jgi:uncharacterized membrane protein YdjX (TVP38/TMEM64 family)
MANYFIILTNISFFSYAPCTLFSGSFGSFGSTGVGQMAGQDFFSHLVPFITAWVSWVKGSMPIKINKNR